MFENIRFKFDFRDYQNRVLNNMEYIMEDDKLHISAAPGSGKTILGLEVLRRLGKRALILVPTINLRNQWKERFFEGFTGDGIESLNFSMDISEPGDITCSTYQALYAVYNRDEKKTEFKKLISLYKTMGIETICLDEAHHLKREWWNALTDFIKQLDIKLIALTATPPMDTSDIEWKRYIELCGPIDLEISIPEMVSKGCLCPHQDYIYISQPTRSEIDEIEREMKSNRECMIQILREKEFYFEVKNQPFLKNPMEFTDVLVKNPDYMKHLLDYMAFIKNNWQVEFEGDREIAEKAFEIWDKRIRQFLDEISKKDIKMEDFFLPLMCDVLELNAQDYTDELREKFTEILTKNHLIRKGKISESLVPENIKKTLRNSQSRLTAIEDIVVHETSSIGEQLRCLVLMDYIRKEDIKKIETDEALTDPGVISAFERLRRQEHHGNLEKYFERVTDVNPMSNRTFRKRIGVLTGSIVILPDAVMEELSKRVGAEINVKKLGVTGYSLYEGNEAWNERLVGEVTELFSMGRIEILIGTAALLGEGWDAPAVNTLIIGSNSKVYVKTNQMRGRALRVDRNVPYKVSNIWHLMESSNVLFGSGGASIGKRILEERFESIVGLRMDGKGIENGIDRMITPEHNLEDENIWNEWMLSKSMDRAAVKKDWDELFVTFKMREVREVVDIPREIYKVPFRERFSKNVLSRRHIEKLANALIRALKRTKYISEGSVLRKIYKPNGVDYYLENESERECKIFAECLNQVVSPLYMPKYMVTIGRFFKKYVAVPDFLASRKELAEIFREEIGNKSLLIYVNTDEGRQILLTQKLRQRTAGEESVDMVRKLI